MCTILIIDHDAEWLGVPVETQAAALLGPEHTYVFAQSLEEGVKRAPGADIIIADALWDHSQAKRFSEFERVTELMAMLKAADIDKPVIVMTRFDFQGLLPHWVNDLGVREVWEHLPDYQRARRDIARLTVA